MAAPHRLSVGALLALGLLAVSPAARGQNQAAPAESLFEEGRALLAQKKYVEACSKLAESEKLDPAVGTLLNLGECYEKMGKIASAWVYFKQAATMAHTAKQPTRERIAAGRVLALEPSIPRLSISVPHVVPGLEVRRDSLVIGQAEWSGSLTSAVTIDPGEHEIVVVAPGKKAWSTKVTLVADGQTTAVEVPELEVDELAERAPLKPASPGALSIEAVNTHDRNVQRAIGVAIAGAGLATVLVGLPFGARAISLNNTAAGECPTNDTCSHQGQSDAQSAVSSALVATLLMSIGAGVIVGGAVVFFTAPSPKHEAAPRGSGGYPPGLTRAALRVLPALDLARGGGGFRVVGDF